MAPLLLSVLDAEALHAQEPEPAKPDSIRDEFRLPVPPPPQDFFPFQRAVPAMSANSPTGFGAQWGDLFVGAAYQLRARHAPRRDGTVAAGMGLGNAIDLVGLEVAVISFSTLSGGFGSRMGVDLKVHRVLPGFVGVAFGWESVLLRGRTDGLRSRYLAASRWFQLRDDDTAPFSAVVLSGGIGNERFVPPDAWVKGRRYGAFGSVGIRVLAPVSFVVDWTGQDLAVATSLAPFGGQWLNLAVGVMDLTGTAGDGARVVLAGSYLYNWRSP